MTTPEYDFDYEYDYLETSRFDYEYEFDYEYDFLETFRFDYECEFDHKYDFLKIFRFDYECDVYGTTKFVTGVRKIVVGSNLVNILLSLVRELLKIS